MRMLELMRRLMPLLLIAPAVTGCAGSAVLSANTPCSSLIPETWRAGVEHAPLPAQSADPLTQLKAWIGFGTAEAAQVEKANGRTVDAIGIVERCEERDRKSVERSRPKFLGIFG